MSPEFIRYSPEIEIFDPKLSTHWAMAVCHGNHVAKVRVAPVAESAKNAAHQPLDLKSGPDVYGTALASDLRTHAFDFDLQVQLCTDLKAMPVNDSTVEWPEELSSFVTVGRVPLPRQDNSAAENPDRGDALSFNHWRVTSDHWARSWIRDASTPSPRRSAGNSIINRSASPPGQARCCRCQAAKNDL